MALNRPTGLRYTPVNVNKPRRIFPSSYYGQSDWPIEVAEIALSWVMKPDGTCCITKGMAEAFILQDNTNIVFPHSIGGVLVSEIAPCAFDILTPFPSTRDTEIKFYPHAKSLTLPDSITTLGSCAIAGLNPQTTYIPASVENIGNFGFFANHLDRQTEKRQFVVDAGNPYYHSIEGSIYTRDLDVLICQARPYPEVIHVPETVKHFGVDAFAYGSSLPLAIHIPDDMLEIQTIPSRDCLWVCSQDSPAYQAAQRNGYYAVTPRYSRDNSFVYDILDSGEVVLIQYRGPETDLVIPDQFAGRPLLTIGPNAFPPKITSITFPDTVKTIAGTCFGIGLRRVKLPQFVETIGPDTFPDGDFDKPVIIPATCTSIGAGSFFRSVCVFEKFDARVCLNSRSILNCFTAGTPPFNFVEYDETLLKLYDYPDRLEALILRIVYPYALDTDIHRRFMLYLKGHQDEVMNYIMMKDDLRVLSLLLEAGFFAPEDIESCLMRFNELGYTQGIVQLIDYRHRNFERSAESRFSL